MVRVRKEETVLLGIISERLAAQGLNPIINIDAQGYTEWMVFGPYESVDSQTFRVYVGRAYADNLDDCFYVATFPHAVYIIADREDWQKVMPEVEFPSDISQEIGERGTEFGSPSGTAQEIGKGVVEEDTEAMSVTESAAETKSGLERWLKETQIYRLEEIKQKALLEGDHVTAESISEYLKKTKSMGESN